MCVWICLLKYNNKKVNDNKAANKTKINKNYLTKKIKPVESESKSAFFSQRVNKKELN